MADTYDLYGSISLSVLMDHTKTGDDEAVTSDPVSKGVTSNFTFGTDAGEADLYFHQRKTETANLGTDYTLTGELTDKLGQTLNFAYIKAIAIYSLDTNTVDITVGAASQDQFINWVGNANDTITIKPGGLFMLTAPNDGYAVTADTGDEFSVTVGDADTTYDIIIIGTSA